MSKELEALNKIQHDFGQLKGQELVSCYETIFKALKRLEAIDNANPSEAMEALEEIDSMFYLDKYRTTENGNKEEYEFYPCDTEAYDTVKQYILKTQAFGEILKKYDVDDLDELNEILNNYRKHWR